MMTAKVPSVHGKPIADDTIERLADQAEAGFDVDALKRTGGRPPIGSAAARVVPVRLDPELDEALRLRVEAENSTASTVIRQALHAWLESA
jgi:hypothetical protein